MWPTPQETADLAIFIEEILNGKLHFLCSDGSEYTSANLSFLFIIFMLFLQEMYQDKLFIILLALDQKLANLW